MAHLVKYKTEGRPGQMVIIGGSLISRLDKSEWLGLPSFQITSIEFKDLDNEEAPKSPNKIRTLVQSPVGLVFHEWQ